MLSRALVGVIRLYQAGVSPLLPSGWRLVELPGVTRSGASDPIPCPMPHDLNQNWKEPAHRWRNVSFSPWS